MPRILDFHCFDLSSLCGLWWLAWTVDFLSDVWISARRPAKVGHVGVAAVIFFTPQKYAWRIKKFPKKRDLKNLNSKNYPRIPNFSRELQGLHTIRREISPVMHESVSPEPQCHSLNKRCCCSTFYVLETMCLPCDDRVKRRKFHLFYIEAQARRRKLERLGKKQKIGKLWIIKNEKSRKNWNILRFVS